MGYPELILFKSIQFTTRSLIETMHLLLFYLLLCSSYFCQAKIFFDIQEFRECGNGKPLPQLDVSDLELLVEDDGTIIVNGTVKFLQDYGSPTRWTLSSKRLQQGEWRTGILSRDVPNICLNLQVPGEPWYPITKLMKQKTCPYKAGHEERADNVNIGNYASIFDVPDEFLGEWQVYFTITTLRKSKFQDECIMSPVSVLEL